MTSDEILRRLRALKALPQRERPYSFRQLDALTGIRHDVLSRKMPKRKSMTEATRVRLERAFLLIENGQVTFDTHICKRRGEHLKIIRKAEPKPVQTMLKRVRMTARGPVVEFVPANALALPELPKINERW